MGKEEAGAVAVAEEEVLVDEEGDGGVATIPFTGAGAGAGDGAGAAPHSVGWSRRTSDSLVDEDVSVRLSSPSNAMTSPEERASAERRIAGGLLRHPSLRGAKGGRSNP